MTRRDKIIDVFAGVFVPGPARSITCIAHLTGDFCELHTGGYSNWVIEVVGELQRRIKAVKESFQTPDVDVWLAQHDHTWDSQIRSSGGGSENRCVNRRVPVDHLTGEHRKGVRGISHNCRHAFTPSHVSAQRLSTPSHESRLAEGIAAGFQRECCGVKNASRDVHLSRNLRWRPEWTRFRLSAGPSISVVGARNCVLK